MPRAGYSGWELTLTSACEKCQANIADMCSEELKEAQAGPLADKDKSWALAGRRVGWSTKGWSG